MRNDHPVIEAAKAGDADRLAGLLDAEPETVNVRGWRGITPLIAATWSTDSAATVRLLLDRGADPLAVRTDGSGALHFAASGEVAELLTMAAGPAGLAAGRDRTPLHDAVEKGHVDVVRAFVAAGADTATLDEHGRTLLDMAGNPRIVRLLVEAGAPHSTDLPSTPLHNASRRAASDADWVPVVELLLDHGADPGLRDEFGALPSDLIGEHGPDELRNRLIAMVEATGRSVELTLDEVAVSPQEGVAVCPDRPEALTTMYSGAVFVRWQLAPSIAPIEVIRVGGRSPIRGPYGAGPVLAFADNLSVCLRDWADLRRSRQVVAESWPDLVLSSPALSPGCRYLAVPLCERVRLIDLDRGEIACEIEDFGDWSVVPRFAPDGKTLAVGNSMQGTWWLTVLELGDDGNLRQRYVREDGLPTGYRSEIVTDVVFTPDGRRFATWVRPDGRGPTGYRGLVATTWTHSGEPAWHLRVDNDTAGAPGKSTSAPLCFTPDGSWLVVGLDSGVLWLDTETGAPKGRDNIGAVSALASHHTVGVVAATEHGLRRLEPPQANKTTLTPEQREAFWRRRGWRPDLPPQIRHKIEARWDDEDIELAEFYGF